MAVIDRIFIHERWTKKFCDN